MRKSAAVCFSYIISLIFTHYFGIYFSVVFCIFLLIIVAAVKNDKMFFAVLAVAYFSGICVMLFCTKSYQNAEKCTVGTEAVCTVDIGYASGNTAYAKIGNRKVLCIFDGNCENYDSCKIVANCKFEQIENDDFPSRDFYFGKNVCAYAYVKDVQNVKKDSFAVASLCRSKIRNVFKCYLGGYSGLAIGMTLGDKSGVPYEWISLLKNNGIMHVLAISGLHISLLVWLLAFIIEKIMLPRKISICIIIFFAFFYMLLTGFAVSVCRAGIMASATFSSYFFRRKTDSITSLCLAGMLLCLISPYVACDLSFIMSFFATLGIVIGNNYIVRRLKPFLPVGIMRTPVEYISSSVIVSLSAISFCMPSTAYFFGKIGVSAAIGNLVCLPFAELFLILSFLLIPLSIIPPVAKIVGAFACINAKVFQKICSVSEIKNSWFETDDIHTIIFSTAIILLCTVSVILNIDMKRKIVIFSIESIFVLSFVSALIVAV